MHCNRKSKNPIATTAGNRSSGMRLWRLSKLGLNNRMEDNAIALTADMQRSTNNVFRALQRQRQQDLALTRTRLEHLATQGELKEQETDADLVGSIAGGAIAREVNQVYSAIDSHVPLNWVL